jgi:phospho-N-acetylmuramoyl-pentapeptide-transferase
MHIFESNPGTGLRAHEKLIIQALIGGILGIWAFKLFGGLFWIPFLGTFNIGLWIIPFAMLSFMGTINSVNISDGMDGLAAGMGIFSILAFTMIAFLTNLYSTALFAISAVGALVTYLYFNIKPARVQMGDTGSFALGALITILAFSIGKPLLLAFAAFPFLIELLSTIIQAISRRIFGRRILQMAPLHHHFEMLGWTEDKVVVRFWLFSLVFALIALWLSFF